MSQMRANQQSPTSTEVLIGEKGSLKSMGFEEGENQQEPVVRASASPTTPASTPEMPQSVLVGLIHDFVDLHSQFTECPVEFLASSFITIFGVAMSPYVARDNAMQMQPRLYTCNVGRSGAERKSTGAERSIRLNEHSPAEEPLAIMEGFGSAEGLLTTLRQNNPVPVVSYLDELDILFKKTAVTGSAGVSVLHKLYESNSYSHRLRRVNLSVTGAHLAIIANSTLDRFPDLWQSGDIDSGFLSRWTLVTGRATKRISNPPIVPWDEEHAICEGILNLRIKLQQKTKRDKRYLMPFADNTASAVWNDFYINELDPDDPMHNRVDTMGDRLMTILTLAQEQFAISAKTVEAVIQFLRYEIQVRKLLCPRVAVNKMAELEQQIMSIALPVIGSSAVRRDIYRKVHADRYGSEMFKKALDGLCDAGRLIKNTAAKRYTRIW
jgi:hypothetical protein